MVSYWFAWRVCELVTSLPPVLRGHMQAQKIYFLPANWDLQCRNSCQENSLPLRESRRASTGENEGNQFLEKIRPLCCLPGVGLCCGIFFFSSFLASVALAFWLKPPTHLGAVNSTMRGFRS